MVTISSVVLIHETIDTYVIYSLGVLVSDGLKLSGRGLIPRVNDK